MNWKYTLRSLRKSPAFTAVAILILALGLGSNVAVFSLIDSLFLRPLPVEKPGELVEIASLDKAGRLDTVLSTALDPLRRERIFRGVCGYIAPRLPIDLAGTVRSASALAMTGDCFGTLGIRVQIGRPFTPGDDSTGADRVALLTDTFRRNSFGPGSGALGSKILVQGVPFTIIGVTEPRFTGFRTGAAADLIIPLSQRPLDLPPGIRPVFSLRILARRAPGISRQQVEARIAVIEKQLLEESLLTRFNDAQRRDYLARRIVVPPTDPGENPLLRRRFGKPLYVLLGICACVLAIACVNLTSLLLARGLVRQKEIAVRLALGASRASVARLLALQSLALVAAGGVLGLLFAQWARYLIVSGAAEFFAVAPALTLDARTALFLTGTLLLVAATLAAVPAWQATRSRSVRPNGAGRGVVGSGARNQKVLLAFQIALTLALVSGSSLFTSSMRHLDQLNLGIQTAGRAETMLAPLTGSYANLASGPYYHDLLQQVESLPDVASVALADFAPFWTGTHTDSIAGVEDVQARSDLRAQTIAVTGNFFETLGLPVIAGQGFRPGDPESGEPVAIVSQSLARFFGGDRIIGRRLSIGDAAPYQRLRVVGIAGDAQLSLENPDETHPLAVYVNLWQHPERQRYPVLLTRSVGAPLAPGAVRRAVQSRGREYVEHSISLDAAKDEALIENQLLAWLSAAFGVLALILAATGLFGLLSCHVAGRTGEIGIRMALGAERAGIQALVLRQLLPVMIAGTAGGLALTLLIGRTMTGLVFGVSAYDPGLLALSIVALTLTALLAAWIPARRASSVDPLVALRHE